MPYPCRKEGGLIAGLSLPARLLMRQWQRWEKNLMEEGDCFFSEPEILFYWKLTSFQLFIHPKAQNFLSPEVNYSERSR